MAKRKDSKQQVIASLENHKLELQRFRDRVNELKLGIEFRRQDGNRLYYSVDFSEIYSYLHYDDPGVHYLGVSIFAGGEEGRIKSQQQHYLALTHLFQTFSKNRPLYLLQPYVLEMYSYARTQAHHLKKTNLTLSSLISAFTNQLQPEHKALLKAPEQLTEEQTKDLLEVIKTEYPKLSVDLLEFERWRVRRKELNTRGQLLKELLTGRRLSHRTDEIFRECEIRDSELEKPSLEEEKRVVDAFPPLRIEDEDRQFSRLVDARALLLLRNMNRLLERRNARMILITRDMKSPKVAEKLKDEEWFACPDIKQYFYGIEAIYLDLILQSASDLEKLEWLNKADGVLTKMLGSVDQVLEEYKDSGSASTARVSTGVQKLLEQNNENWNELVDVEFIRTSPVVDWLGVRFVTKHVLGVPSAEEAREHSKVSPDESALLKQLVTFVDSSDFQEVAEEVTNQLWEGITADAFGMNKLGIFGDRLNEVLTQVRSLLPSSKSNDADLFHNVLANSTSFFSMPTVHFETRIYDDFIKNFRPWNYNEEELRNKIGPDLAELFSLAASNTEKPENCLFMAFVMGMLDYWDHAVEMAEHGSQHVKEKRAEFDYFLAYARSRKVDMHREDLLDALKQYTAANNNILAALKINPYDARYLNRRGTITIQYHDTRKKLEQQGKFEAAAAANNMAREDEAIGFLKQAVKYAGNHRKLRVRALNNLAYAYGMSEPPQLDEAEKCIKQIEIEFDAAINESDPSIPEKEKWPFVMDTMWYLGARIAYSRGDAKELKRNADLLKVALDKVRLMESEENDIRGHIREVEEMQNKLGVNNGDSA